MPLPERTECERSLVPPAEGRWSKPPLVEERFSLAGVLSMAGMAALYVAILFASRSFAILSAGFAFAVLVVAAMLRSRRPDPLERIDETDRMLLENPDDADVCLVRLTVVRDGRVVGRDKGVVWFADGLLLYNGHRTSFAIGGEDVLPRSHWGAAQSRGDPEMSDAILPLRVARGTASIELDPFSDNPPTPASMRFLKRFYDFRYHPSSSTGSRQWPPFEA